MTRLAPAHKTQITSDRSCIMKTKPARSGTHQSSIRYETRPIYGSYVRKTPGAHSRAPAPQYAAGNLLLQQNFTGGLRLRAHVGGGHQRGGFTRQVTIDIVTGNARRDSSERHIG